MTHSKLLGRGAEKSQLDSHNQQVIEELRRNDGRIDKALEVVTARVADGATDEDRRDAAKIRDDLVYAVQCGLPFLILHHFGSKTGTERVNPLAYLKHDDAYVVFATHGGRPNNPLWSHNLIANPRVSIEVEGDTGLATVDVTARLAQGPEREQLWKIQTEIFPPFIAYQARTTRQIPVIVLEPDDRSAKR